MVKQHEKASVWTSMHQTLFSFFRPSITREPTEYSWDSSVLRTKSKHSFITEEERQMQIKNDDNLILNITTEQLTFENHLLLTLCKLLEHENECIEELGTEAIIAIW